MQPREGRAISTAASAPAPSLTLLYWPVWALVPALLSHGPSTSLNLSLLLWQMGSSQPGLALSHGCYDRPPRGSSQALWVVPLPLKADRDTFLGRMDAVM